MVAGVDVVSVSRLADLMQRNWRFVNRVYTVHEQRDCAGKPQRWASTWAAKEAVRKLHAAAGRRLPAFADVEVVRYANRSPRVRVSGASSNITLSLSHEGDLAVAVAVTDDDELAAGLAKPPPAELRLPDRPDDAHKGTFGRVLVVAGSRGYVGAPLLAALGAARGGAGLVSLCVPEAIHSIVAARCLEVMPVAVPDGGAGVLRPQGVEAISEQLTRADAAVIGPGVGRSDDTASALVELLGGLPCPAVVDADALNLVAATGFEWRRGPEPVVVTPHPAEMGRLSGMETAVVQKDRVGVATSYARDHGVVVVLKGSGTVVASPGGRVFVDDHHVVALATGGTGDVLAGVLGAMLAQGLKPFEAAVAAVTVHAEAGERVQAVRGRAGGLASDVVDALPASQERLRRALERRYLL